MHFSKKTISYPVSFKGFTAIEMVLTITIVSMMISMAIPSFTSMMTRYRLSNENTLLMLNFVLARGEAVNRSTRVSICQSSDGANCTNGGWATGHIVFVDGSTVGTVDAGDVILKVTGAVASGDSMTPNNTSFVSFNSTGIPSTNLTITTCKSGFVGAQVIVYPSGRIRKDTTGLCL